MNLAHRQDSPDSTPPVAGRRLSWLLGLLGVGLVVLYLALEGNLLEGAIDVRDWFGWLLRRFGVGASLGVLYIEESGLPLPVPGDVYVAYVGHVAAGSMMRLVAAWLAIIAVVTAGASNLYLISRRWGPRIVEHRMARAFHIEPERIARANRWFDRWGVLAIVFGRHIPGFRVPLTAVAGIVNFPYRKFAPSVAVSTSIWAAFFLLLGDRFGGSVGHFLGRHAWIYAVGTALVITAVAYFGIRAARIASSADPEPQTDPLQ